ncbi:unnamed protein product [Owenia fusiformis]|uniref:Uncharacterized protein n=1 Tax=Owenia fusiformis TaxID=6347 RepID=A0A8J1UM56_OWEFU|nr:unnamed protein product [Owenia fusiformis]
MDTIINYKREDADDYYHILGCDELSSVEQIKTEYKTRVLDCHPDKNPNDPDAAKRFSRLLRAKETLEDPANRRLYDNWKRSGIAMPFEQYTSMKETVKTSMHWAYKTKKEPMLEGGKINESTNANEGSQPATSPNVLHCNSTKYNTSQHAENWVKAHWVGDEPSEMLKKFRNYDI